MDKLRVFGKAMRVMLSKHQTVQLPKEGQPDAGLTRLVNTRKRPRKKLTAS